MGWLSSLFSSLDSSQRTSRRRQELSATHAAFSLPTSSPVFGTHQDAFSAEPPQTPDPEGATSPNYTYPPQGPGAYGHLPSPGFASRQGSASLLPTHMDAFHTPQARYPPLETTWNRLRSWLNREYPELGDTLNYGIQPQELAEIELQFGFALPPAVRDSYLCVDGQEAESAAGCAEGLFFGLTFLPLENVLEEWRFWREVDEDAATGANPKLLEVMQSIPPLWIRRVYSNRGWIPLIADKAGNYIGIDLNPGEQGSAGQVIIFGRDFDTKVVLWNGDGPAGWARWLAAFTEELEAGEGFEIGNNDNSEGSEDDIGYESYYHDGSGHGAGDSGGDSGAGGGLKLSGEYRGWSVLEAWGDRSLRKWHEAGLLPEFDSQGEGTPVGHKPSDSIGLGVADLPHESGVEVAIPVLTVNDSEPPAQSVSTHRSRPSQAVPSISVSKPPAPRPVDVPTENDISPPESIHSPAEDDIEAGQTHGMREFRDEPGLYAPVRRETSDTLPLSPPPPSFERSSSKLATARSSSIPSPSPAVIPDLLEDSTSKIGTIPIQPSTSTSSSQGQRSLDMTAPREKGSPVPSIRLVGGSSAPVRQAEEEEYIEIVPASTEDGADAQIAEAEAAAPAATVSPEADSKPTHKKNKSSVASLKKLGRKSRKDSSASVKDASPAGK
ncbi:hypothetical protein DFP72DRAFT_869399 [Ephemerocybe angulata]|uniref:Knr4/Smi1-like domain-containing protein n=1 Tax=Ephemerocybe angulata TaxID=980116 RepID=A0A8H6MD28_9AGAR|nr:hypothetical protein DFP72DRAFT_869399 [Tulosesus angulatus]